MGRALVTGGTGFVGSHIARHLVDAGHEVRILHRASSKLTALEGIPFESALGDITDDQSLRDACTGVDWVFHVAAVADYWRADQNIMFNANVEGTRRVLHAAKHSGVKRIVFTSSAAAVGLFEDRPSNEQDAFNMRPHHFPYGHSKWLAEQVVKDAVEAGQDIVTVNPVVIMGPGDLNMISGDFVIQIKRFGRFAPITAGGIAVTDVRDVARWHVEALEKGVTGERYIIGTANYDYQTWFGMIADVIGSPRPFLKTPRFVANATADLIDVLRKFNLPTVIDASQARNGARKIYFEYNKAWLTFSPPQVDMLDSLKDTYQWYVEHGYLK